MYIISLLLLLLLLILCTRSLAVIILSTGILEFHYVFWWCYRIVSIGELTRFFPRTIWQYLLRLCLASFSDTWSVVNKGLWVYSVYYTDRFILCSKFSLDCCEVTFHHRLSGVCSFVDLPCLCMRPGLWYRAAEHRIVIIFDDRHNIGLINIPLFAVVCLGIGVTLL